jgi:hypothetical protein
MDIEYLGAAMTCGGWIGMVRSIAEGSGLVPACAADALAMLPSAKSLPIRNNKRIRITGPAELDNNAD